MAANSLLTAQWVARKALILLHAKSNFVGRCNKDYQSLLPGPIDGVILGQVLSIRLPFRYKGRTGTQMSAENSVQRYAQLTVGTQNGVDVNFTSVERAMELNSFEDQVLRPAMAKVAALIETQTAANITYVPKMVGYASTSISFNNVLQAEQYLTEALAPEDDKRTLTVNPQMSYEFVSSNASLFNPETAISDQWLEGVIAERVAGFTAFRNTKLPTQTFGAVSTASTPTVSGGGQGITGSGNAYITSSTLTTSGWTSGDTLNAGDTFTISGVYEVDPETYISLGRLKQFVVLSQVTEASGGLTVSYAPAIITGGSYQNVSAGPAAAAVITLDNGPTITAVTGALVKQGVAWWRDAIIFANPPMLDLSALVKFTAQEGFEGFNIRFAQQWDPDSDMLPARLDTISGSVLAYPELAVRLIDAPQSY